MLMLRLCCVLIGITAGISSGGAVTIDLAQAIDASQPRNTVSTLKLSEGERDQLIVGQAVTLQHFQLDQDHAVNLTLRVFQPWTETSRFVVGTPEGDQPISPPTIRLLRGSLENDPQAQVFLTVDGAGIGRGWVYTGTNYYPILPDADRVAAQTRAVESFTPQTYCATPSPDEDPEILLNNLRPEANLREQILNCDVALDCDYDYYLQHNASVEDAQNYAAMLVGAVSLIYERDVQTHLNISYMRVWDTPDDPYDEGDLSGQLSQFRSYWNTYMGHVDRDVAHLFTSRNIGGGIAYLRNLGTSSAYAVIGAMDGTMRIPFEEGPNTWDGSTFAHELGHNFASSHTHCYNPPIDSCYNGEGNWGCYAGQVVESRGTIMSYCHLVGSGQANVDLNFHPRVQTVMWNYARTRLPVVQMANANFEVDVREGEPPFEAIFIDHSNGNPDITSWQWDFNNDGVIDSEEPEPSPLLEPGHYDVKLVVSNGVDTDSLMYTNYLWVYQFTTYEGGSIVEDGGRSFGSAWADYDQDGDMDAFISNMSNQDNFLYQNNGDGSFTKITEGEIVNDGGASMGASWGDYNNDGYPDLFVANTVNQPNFLYRNNGDGTFTKITEGEIVTETSNSSGGSWGDFDNDGYLDLFVANNGVNFLYHNNGDETFSRITEGEIVTDTFNSFGGNWADVDNDGDLDLFVANNGNNALYLNQGDGTFIPLADDPVVQDGASSKNGSWGDYDNDGDLDLFVTNATDNALYTNNGDGTFELQSESIVSSNGGISQSSNWMDFDNDGDLDLFVTNSSQTSFFYENQGDGTFIALNEPVIRLNGTAMVCSWIDYNQDGDLDLFVGMYGQNNAIANNYGNTNHWLALKLTGVESNTSAIGAKVRLKATVGGEPVWQMREISGQHGFNSQNGFLAHFGVGDATQIDSVVVEWTTGAVQVLTEVAVDQVLTIVETGQTSTGAMVTTVYIPTTYRLYQNHPNPFNPRTTIRYDLPQAGHVSLRIYDVTGQLLKTLVNTNQPAGVYQVEWNGRDEHQQPVSSGIYFYTLRAGEHRQTRRMVVLQ